MPGRWLARANHEGGGRTALYADDVVLSYAEMLQRVESFSARLLQFPHASVVGVCSGHPLVMLLALHATARLGRTLLPLDLHMPHAQREALLRQSGCSLVICDAEALQLPAEITQVPAEQLLMQQAGDVLASYLNAPVGEGRDNIALIIPTTGTTSDPKGVMLSVANLTASVNQVNSQLAFKSADCWLNCLPLSHIAGLSIPYRCVQAGAAMVLHQGFDAERVWQDLEQYQVTHISLVPAMLGRLLAVAEGRMAPNNLRVALVGGGALDASLAARAHAAGWPLTVCYGMSETASMCAIDSTAQAGIQPGRVGETLPGFRITLSEGDRGKIRVTGDAVMAGYANPRLQPGDGLKGGWFESGDLGFRDAQGQLCVTGRADDLLNSGGLRLHPQEVEQLLAACTDLTSVAVSSRSDPLWGDRLVAFYEGGISESQLESWAREHIPSGLRPREFRKIEVLPKNRLGKLDRHALKRYMCSMHHAVDRAEPWAADSRG